MERHVSDRDFGQLGESMKGPKRNPGRGDDLLGWRGWLCV